VRRDDRPYIIARATSVPVAGIVDVSAIPDAGVRSPISLD